MSWSIRLCLKLGNLSLDVALEGDSQPIGLIGPNGAGKTTFLRGIAGAYQLQAGRILIGEDLFFDAEKNIELLPEERRVAYVPQNSGLFPHLKVIDNVAFALPFLKSRKDRRKEALRFLKDFGCEELADRWPDVLSGGERQRVALVRALVLKPRLFLLDEPLSAIDIRARRDLRTFLKKHLAEEAKPAIIVTHDIRDIQALCPKVCVLEDGKIVQYGSVKELSSEPATDFVAEFFAPFS